MAYEPVVDRGLQTRLRTVSTSRVRRVWELRAAEDFLDHVPGADMVKFAKNGSDATTAAIKLARAATGRDLVAICGTQPFFSTDDWFIATTADEGWHSARRRIADSAVRLQRSRFGACALRLPTRIRSLP